MSPAATVLYTAVTFATTTASSATATPRSRPTPPASSIHDDWDALGMRASGSHSVTLRRRRSCPRAALRGGFPRATRAPTWSVNRSRGLFHAAASLGIAESAALGAHAVAQRARRARRARAHAARRERDRPRRAPGRRCRARRPARRRRPDADAVALFAEAQAAKTFVNEAAARIVDRALALSGGAGYLNGHPLARAYRDVSAGSFMHPLGANRAYDLIGDVALGREPALH